jgi:hypothetical protein
MLDASIPEPPGVDVLPQAMHGSACTLCQRLTSRWSLQVADALAPACARCLFYDLPWSAQNRQGLDALLLAREVKQGVRYDLDAEGRVVDIRQLDLLIGAVVLPHRMVQARRRGLT